MRLPSDDDFPERVTLRPPEPLLRELLESYPHSDYPELDSYQDVFLRAAGDAIRCRRRERAVMFFLAIAAIQQHAENPD